MAQLEDQAAVVADDVSAADAQNADNQETDAEGVAALYEDEAGDQADTDAAADGEADGGDGDDAEGADEELEPVAPPHSWKAEEKDLFAKLPRDQQEIIARRETERDRFVNQKAQEASQAEARALIQANEQLAEIHSQSAQRIQQLAAQLMPQPADPRLLYTGSAEDQLAYQRQDAAFRQAQAQQQELLQQAQTEQQRADEIAQANEQRAAAEELRALNTDFPDWFDAGTLKLKPETISRLQPIGEALGYPPELLAQARATDFKALDKAAGWKAKADKWDAHVKKQMAGVRAAKNAPPIARPGAARGPAKAEPDALAVLYPDD